MRLHKTLLGTLLLGGLFALGFPPRADGSVRVSVSYFHEQLAPHGRWVVAGSLGEVWVPSGVVVGWAPYVDGEWTLTAYGWTWVSYDPWGDIPCHYGAWSWLDPYGWVWAPGTVWAPAWVTWAYTDDFIGWAPLPPSFAFSVSGYVGAPVVLATTRYVFVPTTQFVGVRVSSVRVPGAQVAAIFPRASKVTNFHVSGGVVQTLGPPSSRIEKAIGRPIAPVRTDVLKTQPTSVAAAGLKTSRVHVALPEAERGRVTEKRESRPEKSSPAKSSAATASAAKLPEHAHPGKAEEAAPAQSASGHKPATSKATAETRSAAKPEKTKPEKSTAHRAPPGSGESTHSSSAPEEHQAKAVPRPSKVTPPRDESPKPKPHAPTEEVRIASHSVRPPAPPAHSRPQESKKPSPPPKKEPKPQSPDKPQ